MRTLVYGMPSSGASWVAFVLGQHPDTIVIPDTYYFRPVPTADVFGDQDVVLKTTVDHKRTLELAQSRFQPHRTVIVVRDEDAVRASLRRRAAEALRPEAFMHGGNRGLEARLAEMRRVIATPLLWDERIDYEQFSQQDHELTRTVEEIVRYNWENCEWCRNNAMKQKWGLGGIRTPELTGENIPRIAIMVRRGPERVDRRDGICQNG